MTRRIQDKYLEDLTVGFALALSLLVLVFVLGIALLFIMSHALAPISGGIAGIGRYFIRFAGNFFGSSWLLLSLLPISLLDMYLWWRLKRSTVKGWRVTALGSLLTGSLGVVVSLFVLVLSLIGKSQG